MHKLSMKKQKGLSLIALLIIVSLLGVFAIYGAQIGLGYLTQQTIKGTVKNALIDSKANDNATPRTVKDAIFTKLSVNTVDIKEDSVEVTKNGNGFDVSVEYIKEIKVSKQIKIVMDLSFDETTP